MSPAPGSDDALVSVRVAADLCGVPTGRVLALVSSKAIGTIKVRGRYVVSLKAVELAIGEDKQRDSTC